MRKLFALAVAALLTVPQTVHADDGQVVTINGNRVDKTVVKLTFSGDNVVLNYSDNTYEEADMANVSIVFTVADAIKALEKESSDASVSYFDLSGKQLKKAPLKGGYIVKKGNIIVKLLNK